MYVTIVYTPCFVNKAEILNWISNDDCWLPSDDIDDDSDGDGDDVHHLSA
jgi:hypothetical protein